MNKKLSVLLVSIVFVLGSTISVLDGNIPKVYLNGNKVFMQNSPFI